MHGKKPLKFFACVITTVVIAGLLGSGLAFSSPSQTNITAEFPPSPGLFAVLSRDDQQEPKQSDDCIGCRRDVSISQHDASIIEKWSRKYFPTAYAGIYFESKKIIRLVVGYAAKQALRVRAVKRLRRLIAPMRVSEFPYTPEYSLRELNGLQQRILNDVMKDDAHSGLIVSVGVIVEDNLVDVGTERVEETKEQFKELYGEAPIRVHYEEAPVDVNDRKWHRRSTT